MVAAGVTPAGRAARSATLANQNAGVADDPTATAAASSTAAPTVAASQDGRFDGSADAPSRPATRSAGATLVVLR